MPDSPLNGPERRLQPRFSKSFIFSALALAGMILIARFWMVALRIMEQAAPREGALQIEAATLEPEGFAPLRLAGAWWLKADDPRFGGVSALAIDGDGFVALSDAGSVLSFGRPGGANARVFIRALPGGPGAPNRKSGRDSESLTRDPGGRGWWVGFEQRHALFRFDARFERVLTRADLGGRWPDNRGVEALVALPDSLLALPESGEEVVELSGSTMRVAALAGVGSVSDATPLPDGRTLLLLRSVTPLGIRNSLALLLKDGRGYRLSPKLPLPLGAFANGEAIAAEPLPGGEVRLWVMTDNDFRRSARTLLVAIDIPRGAIETRRAER